MSRDIDKIMKEITTSDKDISNIDNINKNLIEMKLYLKQLDQKIQLLDSKIDNITEIMQTFAILLTDQLDMLEADEPDDDESEDEDWNIYESPEDFNSEYDDDEDD